MFSAFFKLPVSARVRVRVRATFLVIVPRIAISIS